MRSIGQSCSRGASLIPRTVACSLANGTDRKSGLGLSVRIVSAASQAGHHNDDRTSKGPARTHQHHGGNNRHICRPSTSDSHTYRCGRDCSAYRCCKSASGTYHAFHTRSCHGICVGKPDHDHDAPHTAVSSSNWTSPTYARARSGVHAHDQSSCRATGTRGHTWRAARDAIAALRRVMAYLSSGRQDRLFVAFVVQGQGVWGCHRRTCGFSRAVWGVDCLAQPRGVAARVGDDRGFERWSLCRCEDSASNARTQEAH